jgi:surface protein
VTAPEDCKFLFANLEKLETFDGTMLDTSQTINMSNMFDGCDFLVEITGLQNWDVSKVENMRSMFAFCEKLDDVSSLAHWNVSSVKDMAQMFFLL